MPNPSQRIGIPSIFLAVDDPTVIPSLSTLAFTASGVTPDSNGLLLNDVNKPLLTTDTYQVIVGLVGRDPSGGYSVGYCSPSSGNLVISAAGDVIKVKVVSGSWPANYNYAVCAAIFLKTNSGNFQLCQFSYIDPADDMVTFIKAKPLRSAPTFTSALLRSTTSDAILGTSRTAIVGITFPTEISPTTGTFNFRRTVASVTVSPNNGPDYQIATSRSVGIEFQTLINDIKTLVQAAGGNVVQYSTGGSTWIESHQALLTAQALLTGNRPVLILMPIDPVTGSQEVRLLIGLLAVNQNELTEAWSKSATTPVSFKFDPAALDKLITNQHSEINYLKS